MPAARSLLERRVQLRPVEYPELLPYRDAIRHAYWLHTEFNLEGDVQDFHARVSAPERTAITRTMLAIAQVEVAVKTFWGDLMKRYPKPEVGAVGYTFAESEVRHQDAYAHLLRLLGLEDAFAGLDRVPAMRTRLAFLENALATRPTGDEERDGRAFARTLLTFSAFVEHVSLFGQFLIMKAFQRERNLFKGVANVVDATSAEEQIHGLFGYQLIRLLREERPHWFDATFEAEVRQACRQGFDAERAILAWIFAEGELAFLPVSTIEAFLQHRFDAALEAVGSAPMWNPDPEAVGACLWFEEELHAAKHVDFFHKRPTAYARKAKAITGDDLFAG
ncbi:MAG: ribonucleotide-diphosphate reductase subunit beta [Trueperaceae bacterium]|nr:ribonucleotide-diphosphate reductase subunit beta [Trueperaceae bacterium]